MKKMLLLALLIAVVTMSTVYAMEYAEFKALQNWKITTPCFNNEGKWYTRLEGNHE